MARSATAYRAGADGQAHGVVRAAVRWGWRPEPTVGANKTLADDCWFSALALLLWCITSARSALSSPLLAHHNLQSLTGAAAIAGIGLAWPLAAPRSYARWRVPALAALRTLLLALPYNFEEGLWDNVFPAAPVPHGGLAWLLSLSNLAVGTGIVMLVLTALGWRLPLRVHMALQAALVALWVHCGVGPHARSKLLSSDYAGFVAGAFRAGELAVAVLVPCAALPPGGPQTQAAAVLMFGWLVVGWLLPTLLLLHPAQPAAAAGPTAQHQNLQASGHASSAARSIGRASACLGWMEARLLAGLHALLTTTEQEPTQHAALSGASHQQWAADDAQQHQQGQQGQRQGQGQVPGQHGEEGWGSAPRHRRLTALPPNDLPAGLQLALRWVAVLLFVWMVCRNLAPLYAPNGVPRQV